MTGQKHLIECHCFLAQFRNKSNPPFHKFIVFSVIDDSDTIVPSYAQCNNCGIIHKIIDICRSEIIYGKEELKSIEKIDDVCLSLPNSIVDLLKNYNSQLPDYQYSRFIIENELWNSSFVLTSEIEGDKKTGKILKFIANDKFRVEPFISQVLI